MQAALGAPSDVRLRRRKCTKCSSGAAVEAAIVGDIQAHAAADQGYPEDQLSVGSKEYTIAFNDNGTWITLAYRAYLWQSPSGPVISVGTVFKK